MIRVSGSRWAVLPALLSIFPFGVQARWATAPGSYNGVVSGGHDQFLADLAPATRGGAFAAVVESSYSPGTLTNVAVAQRIASNGTPAWGWQGVTLTAAEASADWPAVVNDFKVVGDGQGGAVYVWSQLSASSGSRAYAQRLSEEGIRLWGPTYREIYSSAENSTQRIGHAVGDGSGGVILSLVSGQTQDDVVFGQAQAGHVQRITPDGVAAWPGRGVTLLDAGANDPGSAMRLAGDGSGGVLVGYATGPLTKPTETDNFLTLQRINSAGQKLWGADGVTISARTSTNYNLLSDGSGGAYVLWWNDRTSELRMQRLSSQGAPLWPGDGVLITTVAQCRFSAHVGDGHGGVLALWSEIDTLDANVGHVRAQRVSPDGVFLWPDAVTALSGDGHGFRAIRAGLGGAIVILGGSTLLGQRVDVSGGLRWALRESRCLLGMRGMEVSSRTALVARSSDFRCSGRRDRSQQNCISPASPAFPRREPKADRARPS